MGTSVSPCTVGDRGAEAIAAALPASGSILEIDLTSNGINDRAGPATASSLLRIFTEVIYCPLGICPFS
jgi:hypothetical protein